jgi:hypothetical protein
MITKEEIQHLHENGHEEAARILTSYLENPQSRMYVSITQFVNSVCDEIDSMTKNKESILESEDKKFERISTLIKNYSEFAEVFKSGISLIQQEPEAEKAVDFFSKQAKKHGNRKQE